MSYKTLPLKWIKKRELVILGIAVAFIVHFSGVPSIFVTYLGTFPFGVLMVGAGLSVLVYSLLERNRTSKIL
ncbi:MAG TPA: hypothetical protein VFG24_03265 [Nitrosopumilaceae archaeon]|nr:hypothetical protein [Nitrosopumilaceae archaeon]